MSELFMECEEEELEPWQIQVPQVNLVEDDDDDELIFVGELNSSNPTVNVRPTNNQSNVKTIPVQTAAVGRPEANRITQTSNVQPLNPQSTLGVGPPLSQPVLATQPIIINSQGYFVSSSQLSNNSTFITSFGKQYPPGTSFTIVPAGQQHFLPQLAPSNPTPGVIHRPQVQQISKNLVTLSNVQSPAACSQTPRPLSQAVQIVSPPIKAMSTNKGNNSVKRSLPQDQKETTVKRSKTDVTGSTKAGGDQSENGVFKRKCPKCREMFFQQEIMKAHMKVCCPYLVESVFPSTPQTPGKRIMLVKDFYYGRYDGDKLKQQGPKTNTTFKCQSCQKVLKNNVRFMNHMKHHLELEKQNNESWESHTTCQHCYRQYTTPFQLQCHIESAHSPYESSTNCKICELAFESEQVLLEHMKDNHKPGEMPYMCQVCNYRSSFFSEVETHFRSVHENTKELLCPFCLKALRTGHVYMQHYMKHQKKGIHRCGKCRLNFLTYKEKVDHTMHFHKTFKKPTALEGLPPGTKVTIRASFTGPAPVSPTSPKSIVSVVPDMVQKYAQTLANAKLKAKSAKQKDKDKDTTAKKVGRPPKKNNKALKNLRSTGGEHTCIECETMIDDFVSHYPCVVTCGACKYRTSCKVSYGNHMIRFHSTKQYQDKYKKMDRRKIPSVLKGVTLLCLNCDLLVDASESDRMTKHLTERPHHVCKVIEDGSTPKSSFSRADSGKRGYASRTPQLQATSTTDALRIPQSVEPSVPSIPSAAGGEMAQDAGRVPSLKSGDDVILIDDETAAHKPADAAEQGFPAIDLTEDDTVATPAEGLVVGQLREEQSEARPPSPSVACESDVGLDESSKLDVSEQAPSPQEPHNAFVSLEDDSMGTVQAEVMMESPAEDDVLPPEGGGLEDDSMGTVQAEVMMESPAEDDVLPPEGSGLEDDSMGTVQAEVMESPAEDDVLPPEGGGLEDDSMGTVQAEVMMESPPEDDVLPPEGSGLEDDSMGTVQVGVSSLITECPAEDDLLPPEGSAKPSSLDNQKDSPALE